MVEKGSRLHPHSTCHLSYSRTIRAMQLQKINTFWLTRSDEISKILWHGLKIRNRLLFSPRITTIKRYKAFSLFTLPKITFFNKKKKKVQTSVSLRRPVLLKNIRIALQLQRRYFSTDKNNWQTVEHPWPCFSVFISVYEHGSLTKEAHLKTWMKILLKTKL